VGTSKNAKRVAIVHLYFNIIGTLLFLSLFYILNAVVGFSFIDGSVNEVKIAVVHTIFNVSTTLILLPFTKVLEKLAYITIKGDPNENTGDFEQEFRILDERFLQSPSFAVEKCRELTMKMGDISIKNIKEAIELVIGKYDKEKAIEIGAIENVVDVYEDKLGTYLVKISSQDLSENDSRSVSTLLHLIGDFERISDHAQNIAETATERYEKKSEFTPSAEKELAVMIAAVDEILDMSLAAFCNNDLKVAQKIEPLEETIDNLRSMIKNNHITRLKNGECTIENGFILNDLLTDLERTSDHCSNIAVCIIEENAHAFDIHEYINVLKNSGKEFKDQVEDYMKKYAIQST